MMENHVYKDTYSKWDRNYYNHKFQSEDSIYTKTFKQYIKKIISETNIIKNQDSYILDLGGSNGEWSRYVSENLQPSKGVLVYDPTDIFIEEGKEKFKNENFEFHLGTMQDALVSENTKGRRYSFVLLKEVIHYADKIFFLDLLDFCSSNCKGGLLMVIGQLKINQWTIVPKFPRKIIEYYEKSPIEVLECSKIVELRSDCSSKFEKVDIQIDFSIKEYRDFICMKTWGCFKSSSDEELDEYVSSLEKEGLESFALYPTYGFLAVRFNE